MDGFLWLLLQILPLLTVVAGLFFFLGWRFCRYVSIRQSQFIQPSEETSATRLLSECAEAKKNEALWRDKLTSTQAELSEFSLREAQLQKEILRLSDELRALKQAAEKPSSQVQIDAPAAPTEARAKAEPRRQNFSTETSSINPSTTGKGKKGGKKRRS